VKPLLAALALVLGGILALQWHSWSPSPALPAVDASEPPEVETAADAPALDVDGVLLDAPQKEEYASVVERPLFLPERRPPPDEPEAEPLAEEVPLTELDGVDLSAVVITPSVVFASVRGPQDPEPKRLRLGDDYLGWTVKTIEPGRLVLERQGESNEIHLRDYTNAPVPIPPTRLPPRSQAQDGAPADRSGRARQRPAEAQSPGQPVGDAANDEQPAARQLPDRRPTVQPSTRRQVRPRPVGVPPTRVPSSTPNATPDGQ
jgi:hypothetical protein